MAKWKIAGRTAREIGDSIESAVRDGKLAVGAALPSVRALAAELAVSPATVGAAYRDLRLRGVVASQVGLGTRVAQRPPLLTPVRNVPLPPGARDVSMANPDPEFLPDLGPALRTLSGPGCPGPVLYGDQTIDPSMRELAVELMTDVIGTRTAAAWDICLSAGALDGVERILRAHSRLNDEVVVEDPCYSGVLDLVRGIGLRPVPVRLDEQGPIPDRLDTALSGGASIMIITPRAQNPTGAVLTPARARQLRTVLRRHPDVHVIENDYYALLSGDEYAGLTAGRESWTVVRSFSKALGPDLRLAVITGDAQTIGRVHGRQQLGTAWVSHILQRLVVNLLRDENTPPLLQRAARLYDERRQGLIAALAAHGIPATGRAGLNVMIPLVEEGAVAQAMRQAGWEVRSGERHRIESSAFIRVTSAGMSEQDSRAFAADLAAVLTPGTTSRPA